MTLLVTGAKREPEAENPGRIIDVNVMGTVAVLDWARAIVALLRAPTLRHTAYNIAAGRTATLSDLVGWAAEKAPGFHAEITTESEADILQDPTLTDGMWGAYDISRITGETGWRPRPVREALHAYMDWIAAERLAVR